MFFSRLNHTIELDLDLYLPYEVHIVGWIACASCAPFLLLFVNVLGLENSFPYDLMIFCLSSFHMSDRFTLTAPHVSD
jgi:hypothetical protein